MFMCPAQTHVTTICHAFTTVDEDYINAYDCKLTFFSSATSTEAHLLFDAEKLSRHVLSKSYKPQINHFRDPYHRHALPRSQSPVVPPLDQSAVTEDDASVQLYSHDGTPFDFRLLMGHQLKQADRSVTRLTGVSASHVSEPSHWAWAKASEEQVEVFLWWNGVWNLVQVVKDSELANAGKGLFTTRHLHKDDLIGVYSGHIGSKAQTSPSYRFLCDRAVLQRNVKNSPPDQNGKCFFCFSTVASDDDPMVLCDTEGCSQGLHQSCASSVDFGFHTDKEKEWFCVSCTEGTEAGTSVGTVRYIDGRFGGLGAVQMMNDPKGTKTKKNDKANVRFAFVRSDAPNTVRVGHSSSDARNIKVRGVFPLVAPPPLTTKKDAPRDLPTCTARK